MFFLLKLTYTTLRWTDEQMDSHVLLQLAVHCRWTVKVNKIIQHTSELPSQNLDFERTCCALAFGFSCLISYFNFVFKCVRL